MIDAEARMLPWNMLFVKSVAELPTYHQTLDALAPPCRIIWLPTFMLSAEGAWNIQTASGLPPASSKIATSELAVVF